MDGLPNNDRIRGALEDLLGWPPIARSPQLARFLSYIVNTTLEGNEAQIKAYSIAVDVFGRPATFDPQSDPIVRVQARRLRALLDQFYVEGNGRAGVRIHLPVGRYVPEFVAEDGLPVEERAADERENFAEAGPATGLRQIRWPPSLVAAAIAAILSLAIGIGLLAVVLRSNTLPGAVAPAEPLVLVGQFSNLTGMPELDVLGAQLSGAVRDGLAPFEDMRAGPDDPARGTGPIPAGAYLITGVIHPATRGIEVTATLAADDGTVLWNATYAEDSLPGSDGEVATKLARSVVRELGPFRGPVHARGRGWLDAQPRPLPAVSTYMCLITYRLARESSTATQIADALACTERLLKEQPDNALALTISSWLEMRATLNRVQPAASLGDDLAGPLARIERAAQLAPSSSLVHEHLGAIKNWLGRFDAAEQDYVLALTLNPLNTDARAGYAVTLSRSLKWELGGEQAALAIADTPYPSPWYYYPVALAALREGRFEEALDDGRKAMRFSAGEIGTIIAMSAAQSLGRKDVTEELLPRLMAMESLRRGGIMPWLASQINDPSVLARIAVGLGRAGVPAAALTGSF
jgi:TolB-like protein